ncbi:tyrosine-type recombinase/integrase [Bradyrhizobium sp. 2TAF36]|uniref:hypothetical protein n=1 Tax=Bradyrhizobium sp. 2TAF36 TaxID=3233016 RepID=UPI003F91F9FB
MAKLPTAKEIETHISESGLGPLAKAGKTVRRMARAEARANDLVCADGVSARDSELAVNWPEVLDDAGSAHAMTALEDYRRRLGTIDEKEVLIGAALLEELGPEPPANAPKAQRRTWKQEKKAMERIGLFWGPIPYGAVSSFTTDRYQQACKLIPNKRSGKIGLAYSTVKTDIEKVQLAVKKFARMTNLSFYPVLEIPKHKVKREFYLLPNEDARLLWACRGRVWNHETMDWVKTIGPDGRLVNAIDEETLENSKGIARMVVTEVWSGWRDENMRLATWKRRPSHGSLDPENGKIHRTGYSAPPTKKNKYPSTRMPVRLQQHSARWKKSDDRDGHDFIFRKGDDQPYAKVTVQYNNLVEAAGLSAEVILHTHRHTLATWCAHMGVPIQSAAKLIGVTPKTLQRIYEHFSPQTEDTAVEMLADPNCRKKLRSLTREANVKAVSFNGVIAPERAPTRKVKVLQRVQKMRDSDAAVRK